MTRVPPAPVEQYAPIYGADAPLREQVYAQAAGTAQAFQDFKQALARAATLSPRLAEIVRLRVAFHNQCRSCMALRYDAGTGAGLEEGLVCSLEKPQEAPDLTEAEKAALDYADRFATDHLSVDDRTFARLGEHFTHAEIIELGFLVAMCVGYGRLAATLDMVDDLPDDYGDPTVTIAPWSVAPASGTVGGATS